MTTSAPQGMITDAALEALRGKLGKIMTSSHAPYLTETSRDGIRHWVDGVGDANPLWIEEERGRSSPWGRPLAPPTILYAFDRLAIGYRGGLPGIHSMFAGSNWRWLRPLAWGERIRASVRFTDLIERPSNFAGRAFQQISEITFLTGGGEPVAVARSWGFRTERKAAAERGKYREVSIATYDHDEIVAIARRYQDEQTQGTRGGDPRYVEDVTVDLDLPTIVRGPYTVTTAVAFEQGWGGLFIKAHGQAMDYYLRHPGAGIPNEYGVPEPPERVHWDNEFARKVGVPAAYDYGPERISWIATLLTNWIGDAGFLERLHVEVRRHNLIGDLTTCHGRVTAVHAEQAGSVDLDVWAQNQRGEVTAKGTARVRLPSRDRSESRPVTPSEEGSHGL
ncbi:MAG TPA: MaoC family dehydratase N-terminal domain-containing protein [Candidatus Dormibacteraeota bacterium]|nr:MaoC family dehydratase N-terminal domain-containing protein [Candidatus Dormibacteraeota bacterium]